MLLDNEQNRIMKKIENTRKRADQMLEIKKNNEERAQKLNEDKAKNDHDLMIKQ